EPYVDAASRRANHRPAQLAVRGEVRVGEPDASRCVLDRGEIRGVNRDFVRIFPVGRHGRYELASDGLERREELRRVGGYRAARTPPSVEKELLELSCDGTFDADMRIPPGLGYALLGA